MKSQNTNHLMAEELRAEIRLAMDAHPNVDTWDPKIWGDSKGEHICGGYTCESCPDSRYSSICCGADYSCAIFGKTYIYYHVRHMVCLAELTLHGFMPRRQSFLQKRKLIHALNLVPDDKCFLHYQFPIDLSGYCIDCCNTHSDEANAFVQCLLLLQETGIVRDVVHEIVLFMTHV